MRLEKRVESFIGQHCLLMPDAEVLVALSGGADSVALLRMLLRLGYVCYAVHCNFHLRGEENDRDERFVTALCQELNVRLEVLHFDTQMYAHEQHLSVEMAARELRYREFERIRQSENLDAIVVAHHQDDAVETLLLNLIRGAGINGLTGMRVKNGYVVRPLLCLTRNEVLEYLSWLGQTYVTDSTNLTDAYARNKVRRGLLPLMQEINPCAAENIAQAALHLSDAAIVYNRMVTENYERIVTAHADGVDICIALLLGTDIPQTLLFEILHPYGFNSRQVSDVFRTLLDERNRVGRMFYSAEYVLLCDRTHLQLRHQVVESSATVYPLPNEGFLTLPDGTTIGVERIKPDVEWSVPRNRDICVLDASCISQPLIIRHPQEGDRMRPFGMKGSKLLSDLYTDAKLSRVERMQQWVLCHGDDIVWAVGMRASEHCRLAGDESEVLQISYIGSSANIIQDSKY